MVHLLFSPLGLLLIYVSSILVFKSKELNLYLRFVFILGEIAYFLICKNNLYINKYFNRVNIILFKLCLHIFQQRTYLLNSLLIWLRRWENWQWSCKLRLEEWFLTLFRIDHVFVIFDICYNHDCPIDKNCSLDS